MKSAVLALFLAGLHAGTTMAATIELDWVIKPLYDDETVQVGDTVVFNFATGSHNAYIHPSGDCDGTGAILVGSNRGASYTFVDTDAGTEMVFACEIGSHCSLGQIVTFIVTDDAPVVPGPTEAPVASVVTGPTEAPVAQSIGPSSVGPPSTQGPTGSSSSKKTTAVASSLMILAAMFLI